MTPFSGPEKQLEETWLEKDFSVGDEPPGTRLDAYLGRLLEGKISRTRIKKLVEEGSILVGGKKVSAHYHIKSGDHIRLHWLPGPVDLAGAEAIPIDILHEDRDLIVVNKPPGMVVHPAHGNPSHTLVNALLYHIRTLKGMKDPVRPGLVHRLDKDTSGVMVIAKNEKTHGALARLFKDHEIEKTYHALVRGVVQHDEGKCEEPVGRAFLNRKKVVIRPSGGRDAVTYYRVLKRFKKATLIEVRPKTGRTHQIRVHMAHVGHPVLGDTLYGIKSTGIDRQALHAFSLAFVHPGTRKKVYYEAPEPEDFKKLTRFLESEN